MHSGLVKLLVPVSLLALSTTLGPAIQAPNVGAPDIVVTGTVTDSASGRPLSATQVGVRGTSIGTMADDAGRYRLAVPLSATKDREFTLLARRIGYKPISRVVRPSADTITADFALALTTMMLENVVVTATGAQTIRSSVGNAVTYVGAPLAATSPGVTTQVQVRGQSSLSGRELSKKERKALRDEMDRANGVRRTADPNFNTEGYDVITENPFLSTASTPRSTFSIDVDHASYSNVRRFLTNGQRPPRDAVRLEELINYFPYELPTPRGDDPVSITTEVGVAPWNSAHRLVRVGLRGRPIDVEKLPPNNLVFLIDVSGSMSSGDKLPLLKQAFSLLVNELRPQDRVALVVYAGNAGLVLPSTAGDRKEVILQALERLEAGGSTAGGAGIRLAYDIAQQGFLPNGNNRVILATDGDFNVGASSDAELVQLIEERREHGTFLTVLGFGTGNVKDSKMEKLADKGNGNYAYVDNLTEARKVLVTEMGGTLFTVAKDVKLQIEFNPSRVAGYRLLGYENRLLRDEDFKDDTKDAGELGAGHSVTALYEVVPPNAPDAKTLRKADPLRYTDNGASTQRAESSELLYVKLRYKQPTGRTSKELTHVVRDELTRNPSADFLFASAVAEFGMVLRDSPHKGMSSMEAVIARAEQTRTEDEYGYRAEFVRLANQARTILERERVASRGERQR
jgi:Ca-activated chloride channel homolog